MVDLDKLLDMYYDKFEMNYPLNIVGDMSDEEIAEDIMKCIESGEPAKEPEYEDGLIY